MHRNFPDWYRQVSPEPAPELLDRRAAGIAAYTKKLAMADGLHLVTLAGGRFDDAARTERFRESFRAHDSAFRMNGNDLELALLAATAIAEVVDAGAANAAAIALATVCADARGLRQPPIRPEATDTARRYLERRAQEVREQGDLPQKPTLASIKTQVDTAKAQFAANTSPGAAEPVAAALAELAKQIVAVTDYAQGLGATLRDHHEVLSEETNILWWVFGEHSRDLNVALRTLPMPAAALVAGSELADLTLITPGPIAARAFLEKILRAGRRGELKLISIADAVNQADLDWRRKRAATLAKATTLAYSPLLTALRTSTEVDGPKDWFPAFKRQTSIDPEATMDAIDLALQAHEEWILVRGASG